jgi:hypothetical protein
VGSGSRPGQGAQCFIDLKQVVKFECLSPILEELISGRGRLPEIISAGVVTKRIEQRADQGRHASPDNRLEARLPDPCPPLPTRNGLF